MASKNKYTSAEIEVKIREYLKTIHKSRLEYVSVIYMHFYRLAILFNNSIYNDIIVQVIFTPFSNDKTFSKQARAILSSIFVASDSSKSVEKLYNADSFSVEPIESVEQLYNADSFVEPIESGISTAENDDSDSIVHYSDKSDEDEADESFLTSDVEELEIVASRSASLDDLAIPSEVYYEAVYPKQLIEGSSQKTLDDTSNDSNEPPSISFNKFGCASKIEFEERSSFIRLESIEEMGEIDESIFEKVLNDNRQESWATFNSGGEKTKIERVELHEEEAIY